MKLLRSSSAALALSARRATLFCHLSRAAKRARTAAFSTIRDIQYSTESGGTLNIISSLFAREANVAK